MIAERIAVGAQSRGASVTVECAADVRDIAGFDGVVIGSAVYRGRWLPEAKEFALSNADLLRRRPVWLFSSGPLERTWSHRRAELPDVQAIRLATAPRSHRTFAGAFDRANPAIRRLPLTQRVLARTVIRQGDFRDWESIDRWADDIAIRLSHVAPH